MLLLLPNLQMGGSPVTAAIPDYKFVINPIYRQLDKVVNNLGVLFGNIVSKTTAYTVVNNDYTIECGAGNQSFTVTLIPASSVKGKILNIKNMGTGTITIDGDGSDTIDGGITAVISVENATVTIQSNGVNWSII